MDNLAKYNQCFISVLGVSGEQLNDSFTFSDTDVWDSLAHLTLVAELEDSFDILLESEDVLNFGSYENGKQILKRYGVEL